MVVTELADKVDTMQARLQSLTVVELHDSEVEVVVAVTSGEVVEVNDLSPSDVSEIVVSAAGQSPMVTPNTWMQEKVRLGRPGHTNSMLVNFDARFQIRMSSPLPPLFECQITGRMVGWPSIVVVYQVLVLTPERDTSSVETPSGIVVQVAVTLS